MPITFHTTRQVEFNDTDMAGIAHFSKFFCWMEEAEHEFLRSRGLSVIMKLADGREVGYPRVAARCDFAKPVRFEDVFDIYVTLERIGGKSLTFDIEFKRNGESLAKGKLTTCCCLVGLPGGMKAIEHPAEIRRKLEGE